MVSAGERRAYPRLNFLLAVECASVEPASPMVCRGVTRNVSSGGLYLETATDGFRPGGVWQLELSVPPGEGHFPYEGQVQAVAEVLRVEDLAPPATSGDNRRFGIAGRFREPLKLRFHDP